MGQYLSSQVADAAVVIEPADVKGSESGVNSSTSKPTTITTTTKIESSPLGVASTSNSLTASVPTSDNAVQHSLSFQEAIQKNLETESNRCFGITREFWQVCKNENGNCLVSGSFPLAVLHKLTDNSEWSTADFDVFVNVKSLFTSHDSHETRNNSKTSFTDIVMRVSQALGFTQTDLYMSTAYTTSAYSAFDKEFNHFILASFKRKAETGRTINLIVVNAVNFDRYSSLREYIATVFDMTCCTLCSDGNQLFLPYQHRDDILHLRAKTSRCTDARIQQYLKRSVKFY